MNYNKNDKQYINDHKNTKALRAAFIQWVLANNPTHFLTIQMPIKDRTNDNEQATSDLNKKMKLFIRYLTELKHWERDYRRYIKFFYTTEYNHTDGCIHAHFYICNKKGYDIEAMNLALQMAGLDLNKTFYLEPISYTPSKCVDYGTKLFNKHVSEHQIEFYGTDITLFDPTMYGTPKKDKIQLYKAHKKGRNPYVCYGPKRNLGYVIGMRYA